MHGIEAKITRKGIGRNYFRAGQKGQGFIDAVIPTGKVSIKRTDDGIWLSFHTIGALPLPDARTAGVRQDRRADLLKRGHKAVPLHGMKNPLGSRRH